MYDILVKNITDNMSYMPHAYTIAVELIITLHSEGIIVGHGISGKKPF